MKVSEVMNKAFVIDDNISLKAAANLMSGKSVGSLIVMKKNRIIGIVTERDVMKNISKLNAKVSGVMSKNVITIEKGDTVEDAAELMAAKKIKRLPVLGNDELVGIVTATDIIAHSEDLNEDFFFD